MRSRAGLSVAGLMVVVALVGLSMAAFRAHFSLGCFVGVLSILSIHRYSGIETTCRRIGRPLERRERPAIFARSFAVSFVILAIAAAAALSIYLIGGLLIESPVSHGPKFTPLHRSCSPSSPLGTSPVAGGFTFVARPLVVPSLSNDQRSEAGTGLSPDIVFEELKPPLPRTHDAGPMIAGVERRRR